MLLIDIADGDHVFLGNAREKLLRGVAGGDQGDVELIARGVGAEKFKPRQDQRRGADKGGRLEKPASFDGRGWSLETVLRSAQLCRPLRVGGLCFHAGS